VARDLAAFAAILDGLRRHEEAEAMHRRALAIFEQRFGHRHVEIAYTLANLAACLSLQGRTLEAEALMIRALEMQKKFFSPHHPEVEFTQSNLAVLKRSAAGERHECAILGHG
jgi:tetratricopeptide (TPR) repeat protein